MTNLWLAPKDRPIFWAWVAWRDAVARAQVAGLTPPVRPAIVSRYVRSHTGGIPKAWWVRYQLHRGGIHPPPKPPPPIIPPIIVPHVGLSTLIQRGVFAAEEPLSAIGLPPGSFVYLTCDPNPSYSIYLSEATIHALRSAQIAVSCWGNQSQIGAERIFQVHRDYKLDGLPIFQFETADEGDTLIAAGAKLGVGNGNGLRPDQIAHLNELIDRGEFAGSQEAYTNLTGPYPKDTSAAGLKVCSLTIGNYDGSHEVAGGRYVGMPEYHDNTRPEDWRTICQYHAHGNRDGWSLFPRGPA